MSMREWEVGMHTPIVQSDGGPWADHDYACPVCQEVKAVLNVHNGVFQPCDNCRFFGWELRRRKNGKQGRWGDSEKR